MVMRRPREKNGLAPKGDVILRWEICNLLGGFHNLDRQMWNKLACLMAFGLAMMEG